MAYTAADVKNLRERTGAGMMDCKKALDETGGDLEAAVDALRAKGLAAVAKKSSRTAAEGLVGVAVSGTRGVAVEVNSETDFVAKNDQFQDFVRKTTEVALGLAADDVEALKLRQRVLLFCSGELDERAVLQALDRVILRLHAGAAAEHEGEQGAPAGRRHGAAIARAA